MRSGPAAALVCTLFAACVPMAGQVTQTQRGWRRDGTTFSSLDQALAGNAHADVEMRSAYRARDRGWGAVIAGLAIEAVGITVTAVAFDRNYDVAGASSLGLTIIGGLGCSFYALHELGEQSRHEQRALAVYNAEAGR
jgi:hypothetical protein